MQARTGAQAERLARQVRRLEVRRIKQHFARVIEELAAKDTRLLTPPQRSARARQLAELRRYALRGRFPRNPDFLQPTPYFVDREGTRCAMAHLIESTGERELVRHVASTRNNARVRELADEPALLTWLEREGLTVEEAGRIQPEYCSDFASECFCSYSNSYYSVEVVYEAIVTSSADWYANGAITAIHGTGALHVGERAAFYVNWITVEQGDAVLLFQSPDVDALEALYLLRSDGTVDTTSCHTTTFGSAPSSAPKRAVIKNLLGTSTCGDGLASEWTDQIGSCSGYWETDGTGGEGGGGEGGGPSGQRDGHGCSTSSTVAPLDGAVLVVSVMLAGALRRRTRLARRRRRQASPVRKK